MPKKKHQKTSHSRTHTRRRRLNLFPILFWLILLGLAGAVIYFGYKFIFDKSYDLPDLPVSTSSQTPTSAQPKSSTEQKSETKTDEAEKPEDDGKTPEKYDGDDANTSESLTGVITYAAFSNGKLVIRTNIDQYLSSGSCALTLSDGSNSVSRAASIVPEASTSTCEGFDVPTSELSDFDRPIAITINLSSGDRVGTITGSVE